MSLKHDIETYNMDKLALWFKDSLSRYQMIDMDPDEAETELLMMLLTICAGTIGTKTAADPAFVGAHFAKMIINLRTKEKRKGAKG